MNKTSPTVMPILRCCGAVLVLLLAAGSVVYLFALPGISLFGSEWLSGFLFAFAGAACGTLLLLTDSRRTRLCSLAAWLSWAALALYLLILTPLGYVFGT